MCFYVRIGLDLTWGGSKESSSIPKGLRDNLKAGVLEPAMSKIKAFKAATEAAIAILRIDDMIKLATEENQGR